MSTNVKKTTDTKIDKLDETQLVAVTKNHSITPVWTRL